MNDLEDAWEIALAEATQRARGAGRADLLRYLDLRRRNDLLRRAATEWLHESMANLAGEANRAGAAIQIEHQDNHRFRRGQATMVGKLLTLRKGLRALIIESGWPRGPRDGVVRGNGLACANIKHLGRARKNEELLLVSSAKGSPQWLVLRDDERSLLSESDLRRHFAILLQT